MRLRRTSSRRCSNRTGQKRAFGGHLMKFEWASKEYAQDVYEQFKSYVITREQKRINSSGNENITWCFQTIVHPDLDYLGDRCLMINYMNTLALTRSWMMVGSWF